MLKFRNKKGTFIAAIFFIFAILINGLDFSRLNVESNKPLLGRLEKLEQDIKKQQQEVVNIQSNILRNEMRIKELVQK